MAECIVCKGEYTPGSLCPRCRADNRPWERWQQNRPEERGELEGLEAFMRPHLYLPLAITIFAFFCSLLGIAIVWDGIRPGFRLLAVILIVGGCLLVTYANYEARHSIREQMLLAPLRRGWLAALNTPRRQAIIIPALTILLAFLLVAGMVSSRLLRELLCRLVFDPGYCKEDPGGFRERVTEALPLILMLCSGGFLVSFTYSSSLLLAMRYAKEKNRALPRPLFTDDNRLADVVRKAVEEILGRTGGMVVHMIGTRTTSGSTVQQPTWHEEQATPAPGTGAIWSEPPTAASG